MLNLIIFLFFLVEQEVKRLIAETEVAEKLNEVDCEIPVAEVERQDLGSIITDTNINSNVKSVSVQSECFVRNIKVQTVDKNIAPVKIMKTKGTQTLLTSDYLSRKLSQIKLVSSACQTSPISDEVNENSSQVEENI